MHRQRFAAALLGGVCALVGVTVDVPAQEVGLQGAIHRGTCDSPGERVADLGAAALPGGSPRGNADAVPATSSFTSFAVPFEALVAEDHVVVTTEPGGDMVACGAIGGIRNDDGALVVGLSPESKSGIIGIAYVIPGTDPTLTNLSLFVAGDALAGFALEPVAAIEEEASEGIVAGGGVEVLLTPLPVAEPEPAPTTAAPQVGFTSEEAAYADEVVRISGAMVDSFTEFTALMENPRIGQDDWTISVAAQLVAWDSFYQEALALEVPPVFADTHALFLEALRLYSEAGGDIALGIDSLDPALLELALGKVNQANELMVLATEEANRVQQERGG